jgi:hypothetical protein
LLSRRSRWWVAVGAFFYGACGTDSAVPVRDGALNVPPDSVHALATLEVVARVVDIQPTADGRVWVLNSVEPYFVVLGRDGQVERQFGEGGGGPGEFNRPVALVRGADPEEVWTYDWGRNALIRISAGDRRVLALPPDSMSVPSLVSFKGAGINHAPPWLERTRDGFLLARARVPQYESALHLWNADILLVREGAPEASVSVRTPIADHLGDPEARYPAATVLLPYPLWTACGDGTVGLYDPLANTLRRFTEEQEEVGALSLPDERQLQMTADLVFDLFYNQLAEDVPPSQIPEKEEMRRMTAEQNGQFVTRSAEFFPEYADLRCTPDGSFWLRPFDVAIGRLGHGPNWLRVSPDGSVTSVALPASFRTFRIEADRIWGSARDALGVESVAWVSLDSLR